MKKVKQLSGRYSVFVHVEDGNVFTITEEFDDLDQALEAMNNSMSYAGVFDNEEIRIVAVKENK